MQVKLASMHRAHIDNSVAAYRGVLRAKRPGASMNAGEICNREVIVGYRNMSLSEAAKLMREYHVGSLVVVVDRPPERVPVGILTDRDLALAVIAKELDPRKLEVGDVMGS